MPLSAESESALCVEIETLRCCADAASTGIPTAPATKAQKASEQFARWIYEADCFITFAGVRLMVPERSPRAEPFTFDDRDAVAPHTS